jgi:divalent metal cation (Fe/Co/Zn/Cd) transporter
MHQTSDPVPDILHVYHTRARWVGHGLHTEAALALDPSRSVRQGTEGAERCRTEAIQHLPERVVVPVSIRASEGRTLWIVIAI